MTAPLTYREALERVAELERTFDERLRLEIDRELAETEQQSVCDARSETLAVRAHVVLIEHAYGRLVRALEPVLGPLHVDEPMVIHDVRAAMEGVEDEIRDAKRE